MWAGDPVVYCRLGYSPLQLSLSSIHIMHSIFCFFFSGEYSLFIVYSHWGVLKTKAPKTPKTLKLENKDSPYLGGLRNYDQPVANTTES